MHYILMWVTIQSKQLEFFLNRSLICYLCLYFYVPLLKLFVCSVIKKKKKKKKKSMKEILVKLKKKGKTTAPRAAHRNEQRKNRKQSNWKLDQPKS